MKTLYPGSIMVKRVKYTIFLSMITLNIWVSDLEDKFLAKTSGILEGVNTILPIAKTQSNSITKLIPFLKEIESRWGNTLKEFGVPNSKELEIQCNYINEVDQSIQEVVVFLQLLVTLLRWASVILAIQIAYSLYWMYMDFRLGKQKAMTAFLVALSILINWNIHLFLKNYNFLT